MALSTSLTDDALQKIQEKLDAIEFFQEQIVVIDDQKSLYDQGIVQLETQIFDAQEEVNDAFGDVQAAYDDRIVVGCRTDLFWRVTGISTNMAGDTFYDFKCTKLDAGGYEYLSFDSDGVGIGSTVRFLNSNGTITNYPINADWAERISDPGGSWFGFENRHLYGLKYYQQPYGVDIGDTFVSSFIGTMAVGQFNLTVMSPLSVAGTATTVFEAGQIVVSERQGVFAATAKITGVGTGYADLSRITSLVGIGTTVSVVNILTLDTQPSVPVIAPMNDGEFVSFRVIDDPDDVPQNRRKYEVQFAKDPFNPETIGIATTGTVGLGVSIFMVSNGESSASQSWDRNFEGIEATPGDEGSLIEEPIVGSGRIFYTVGFTSAPTTTGGVAQAEGATLTSVDAADIGSLYGVTLPACSAAVESAITDAIGVSSTKETSLIGEDGINALKLEASQGLRSQRNELYNLRIWGMRQCINNQNDEVDRLESLNNYIGLSTVSDALG